MDTQLVRLGVLAAIGINVFVAVKVFVRVFVAAGVEVLVGALVGVACCAELTTHGSALFMFVDSAKAPMPIAEYPAAVKRKIKLFFS